MKNVLLITLGHSPMIVPEVVLGYGTEFDEVHVFTTENNKLIENHWLLHDIFCSHFKNILFTTTVLKGIKIINTTESYHLFNEALFQWYIEKSEKNNTFTCISGGTKTIPASMQQAARYFGSNDVFHILADLNFNENPNDFESVKKVVNEGKLKFVSMGEESGWDSLRRCTSKRLFSETIEDPSIPYLFWKQTCPSKKLSNNILHIMQSVKKAAIGKEDIIVPFSSLRLLPPELFSWLLEPLNSEDDVDWIKSLPKSDLHCHLGGFATQPPLLNEVIDSADKKSNLKTTHLPQNPIGWPLPQKTILLQDYMKLGDANGSAILSDSGCLKKQIELLYEHFLSRKIQYAEVRCSPDNYASKNRTTLTVLNEILEHFERLMKNAVKEKKGFCQVNIIVIATRKTEGDLSSISRHLALAITAAQFETENINSCRVVGVDLAGYENKDTRPAYFANDFIGIHRSGIAVTAHAGENDDAESIWQAVHQLHARRIGHALQLYEAKDLIRTIAERKIGIEMCPYANYQIKGYFPMNNIKRRYPLLDYLDAGVLVTVNTDNIGISNADINDNFLFLGKLNSEITRMQILQLIRNSLEVAFINPLKRQSLVSIFDELVLKACLEINIK